MQALVKTQKGKGFLELKDMPDPKVGSGEVLVCIKAAGICGTDIHIEEGRFPCVPPVILGHEFSGEIIEVASDVSDYKAGDRIVAEPHKGGCGKCRYCLSDQVEVCTKKRAIGYKIDGCFAPYLTLPASSLHPLPDNVSFEQGAVTEPLAVVCKAVLGRTRIEPEDFVVVLGCGPIGLLAAAAAKAAGARSVMITGTSRDETLRLPAAREMQLDFAVNIEKDDPVKQVMDITDGIGADVVVEASGAAPAIRQAFELVRTDGRICGLGLTGKDDVGIPWDMTIRKAIHLTCSFSSNRASWKCALSLMSEGKVNIDPVITGQFPLDQWAKAFALVRNLEAIKVLLIPQP